MNGHQPEQLVMSAAILAKRLAVSERHLWAMHADGRLGPLPLSLGRAKRWSIAEIEAWLAAGAPPRTQWQAAKSDLPRII